MCCFRAFIQLIGDVNLQAYISGLDTLLNDDIVGVYKYKINRAEIILTFGFLLQGKMTYYVKLINHKNYASSELLNGWIFF